MYIYSLHRCTLPQTLQKGEGSIMQVKFESGGYPQTYQELLPFLTEILAKLWFTINYFWRDATLSFKLNTDKAL